MYVLALICFGYHSHGVALLRAEVFHALEELALPRASYSQPLSADQPDWRTSLAVYAFNCTIPVCTHNTIVVTSTIESWPIGYGCPNCVRLLQLLQLWCMSQPRAPPLLGLMPRAKSSARSMKRLFRRCWPRASDDCRSRRRDVRSVTVRMEAFQFLKEADTHDIVPTNERD